MSSWLARRTGLAAGEPDTQLGAYREGRRDERLQAEAGAPDLRLAKAELNEAHDRGRREGRLSRRGSALGVVLVTLVLAAAVGAVAIGLAINYGSFGLAGQRVDLALTSIAQAVGLR